METLIKEFLDSNLRNAWLETSDIKLYVRKGHHLIDGKLYQTFDVASVEVVENKRGLRNMKKKYKIYKLETKSHDNGWRDRYYTVKLEQDGAEHWNEFETLELAEEHLQTLLKPWIGDEYTIVCIYRYSDSE